MQSSHKLLYNYLSKTQKFIFLIKQDQDYVRVRKREISRERERERELVFEMDKNFCVQWVTQSPFDKYPFPSQDKENKILYLRQMV